MFCLIYHSEPSIALYTSCLYHELAKAKFVNRNGTIDVILKAPHLAFEINTNNRSSLLYYVLFEIDRITLWNSELK